MATLKALQARIAKLQAQAETIARRESSAIMDRIRELMETHRLTPDDIAAHFGKRTSGRKGSTASKASGHTVAAKYVNPKTGATWTGRGRAPEWIANVKDRTRFLIDGQGARSAAVSAHKAKQGNYVRGPQAPKYRDPASGATWSGRGPAPAWLASAKDRTRFLIADGAASSAPAKKSAVKKSASTRTSAKKTTAAKKSAAKKATAAAKRAPARKTAAAKKSVGKQAAVNPAAANGSATAAASTPAAE